MLFALVFLALAPLLLTSLVLAALRLAGLMLPALPLSRSLARFASPDFLRIVLVAGVLAVHGRIARRPLAVVAL